MKYENQLELIGNTPLLYLNNFSKKYKCNIYLKLEKYNLTGSSKDRVVKNMIINALKSKRINNESTIIEPTSGNTGIALASICASMKLKCIIVMPSNANIERIRLIKILGAEVVLTNSHEKMKGSIKKAKELLKTINNSFMLSQFDNIDNPLAHYKNTAIEIINELDNIDGFFSSYGTGGSIFGISKCLKEYNKNIKVITVRPMYKRHRIDGVFPNIKSKNYVDTYIDNTICVDDVDTINMVEYVAKKEGILIGPSSSLALCGALSYLKNHKLNNIVIFCSDGLERYLSNKFIFNYNYDIKEDLTYMHNIMFFNKEDYYFDDIWLKYRIKVKEVKKIKTLLLSDAKATFNNDPAANSINQIIETYPGFYATFVYRIAHYIFINYDKLLARRLSEYAHSKTAIDIHPGARIDSGFVIDHGSGIVIGETTKIGKNVRIYQGVTLGALSLNNVKKLRNKKRHPTIKNNVIIYAGASILGGNTIVGNNVVIGSNTFITSSINDNKIVILSNNNYTIKEKKYDI